MTPLRVFIGWDSQEVAAWHVLAHSVMTHASGPVAIIPLYQPTLRANGLYRRERGPTESTEFSLTRFLVPALSGYQGYSLFMDCDMLCRGDVYDVLRIAQADTPRAVWVVPHDYTPTTRQKFLCQPQTRYAKKNWSSLMLFDNPRCVSLTPHYVNQASGLDLHQFAWTSDDQIGRLPLEWNWLVGEYEKNDAAKLYHYTLGGPWFRDYQFCDHADLWFAAYDAVCPTLNVPKPAACG